MERFSCAILLLNVPFKRSSAKMKQSWCFVVYGAVTASRGFAVRTRTISKTQSIATSQ